MATSRSPFRLPLGGCDQLIAVHDTPPPLSPFSPKHLVVGFLEAEDFLLFVLDADVKSFKLTLIPVLKFCRQHNYGVVKTSGRIGGMKDSLLKIEALATKKNNLKMH